MRVGPHRGSGLKSIAQPQSWLGLRDDPDAKWPYLTMSGTEVFRWATGAMADVGRLARPEDVADTVIFMASSSSSYINGQVVQVDGG